MALILMFLFKTPLRKLVIMALDKVKRGRGPVVVKTVAGTIFVVLLSSVYSMVKIQQRTIEAGAVNPTDQVLMSKHMLETSLMGNFSNLILVFQNWIELVCYYGIFFLPFSCNDWIVLSVSWKNIEHSASWKKKKSGLFKLCEILDVEAWFLNKIFLRKVIFTLKRCNFLKIFLFPA